MRDVLRRLMFAALGTLGLAAQAEAQCGDGHVDVSREFCDDGNTDGGDGCNASCETEAGYTCTGDPSICCFADVAAGYALRGAAHVDAATDEVILTEDEEVQVGLAWYRATLDLTSPFSLTQRVFLGTNDDTPQGTGGDVGGDGMSLLLQRDPRGLAATGAANGELGAYGIVPVVGVELDTFGNGADFADVTRGDEDHTAIFHTRVDQDLVAATCLNAGDVCQNMEDGRYHLVTVSWSGREDHHLRVSFDGAVRIDYDGDLVADEFDGDPAGIYFGFGASTGSAHNLHKLCPSAPDGFRIPRDTDGDGIDDADDDDDDGDGLSDADETGGLFADDDPSDDADRDGTPNYADATYWSGALAMPDACPDVLAPIGSCDSYPSTIDADRDGVPAHLQASAEDASAEPTDRDGDGVPDGTDIDPDNPCWPVLDTEGCPTSDPNPVDDCDASAEGCATNKRHRGCSVAPGRDGNPTHLLGAGLAAAVWVWRRRRARR